MLNKYVILYVSMADGGPPVLPAPPAPQPHPVIPPVPPAHPIKPAHVPQLKWSHFQPEFVGKPDEDAEAHLLRMNDWLDTHTFQEGVKVQFFV